MLNYQQEFILTTAQINASQKSENFDIAEELVKILFKPNSTDLNWVKILLHIPRIIAYIVAYLKEFSEQQLRVNNTEWFAIYTANSIIEAQIETRIFKKNKPKINWWKAVFKFPKIVKLTKKHLENLRLMNQL